MIIGLGRAHKRPDVYLWIVCVMVKAESINVPLNQLNRHFWHYWFNHPMQ